MESWEECAKREVQEEMGISITHLKLGHVTNDIMESEDKHYVTIFMMGDCTLHEKRPKNMRIIPTRTCKPMKGTKKR